MSGTVDEPNVIITRLVKIDALECAVDRQNGFRFVVGFGGKIFSLTLGEADHSGGGGVDIERR